LLYTWFKQVSFASPVFFIGLLLLPVMVYWYLKRMPSQSGAFMLSGLLSDVQSWRSSFRHSLFVLRLLSVLCIVMALARPQYAYKEELKTGNGIDIILCIDISGSMMAQDLQPDRLEAAKSVAINFIEQRVTDRIGVVVFSGESFTLVPLTLDKQVLRTQISGIQQGLIQDGTAIGDGLGISISRIMNSTLKTKIVILLTDGVDQGGRISPLEAKAMAKSYGIRIYTIGVGTEGYAPFPVQSADGKVTAQLQKVTIDEPLLRSIAEETGARYYRAKDNKSLASIYKEIDELERTPVTVKQLEHRVEKFHPFAITAALLLLLEWILRLTLFRKFP
jgi:Ca-activated chloride channel family protein